MGNLGPYPGGPPDYPCPFQRGKARGAKNGQPSEDDKTWLLDTGAPISRITTDNARNFDLTPVAGGQEYGGVTGQTARPQRGLTMVFRRKLPSGEEQEVTCNLPVIVLGSADDGPDHIGMDQLTQVGAQFSWDPKTRTGDIESAPPAGQPAPGGNIGPPASNPQSRQPYQRGRARGRKNGNAVEVAKEWLVDTGAPISVISRSNARKFDYTVVHQTPDGVWVRGITMVFTIEGANGQPKEVTCNLDVLVPNIEVQVDVLGMDQLASVNARIIWDPVNRTGKLVEAPPVAPPPGGSGPSPTPPSPPTPPPTPAPAPTPAPTPAPAPAQPPHSGGGWFS